MRLLLPYLIGVSQFRHQNEYGETRSNPGNVSVRMKSFPALPGTRKKRNKNKVAKQSRKANR